MVLVKSPYSLWSNAVRVKMEPLLEVSPQLFQNTFKVMLSFWMELWMFKFSKVDRLSCLIFLNWESKVKLVLLEFK